MENIYSLILIIAFVSFLGFIVENLWIGITKGYIDNRGMAFPFLLGYGLTVTAIYFAFGTPNDFSFLGKEVGLPNPKLKNTAVFYRCYVLYFSR